MKGEAMSSFLKVTLSSAGVGAGFRNWIFPFFDSVFTIPVFGVQVTTIGAAAVGAALSLFFGDTIESRRMLFGQVIASTLFGVAVGILCADGLSLAWAQKNLQMFVLMMAALMRWFLPSIIARGKELIKDFKFPFTKKTDGEP